MTTNPQFCFEPTRRPLRVAITALGLCLLASGRGEAATPPESAPSSSEGGTAAGVYFEPNSGQAADGVRFISRGADHNLVITDDALWLRHAGRPTLRFELVGAARFSPRGRSPLSGVSHYQVGSDPRRWRSNVPHFEGVEMGNVYPGIDLVAYGRGRDLEYDFVVAPGRDPRTIRLRFSGVRSATLDAAGDLLLETEAGVVKHEKPIAYQRADGAGARLPVAAMYRVLAGGDVAIDVGPYDRGRALVIDPVLSATKRHGGGGNDQITDIALDASGNVYATGYSEGNNFPITSGAAQTSMRGDVDAFVSKFNASGTLVYSTFYGGAAEDVGQAIALDAGGRAYVVGGTKSTNLSIVGGFQSSAQGKQRSFLLVLSAAGTAVSYSSYLGGSNSDADVRAWDVAVASNGEMWVTGQTSVTTFPFAANGFQNTHAGDIDAFVLRVDPARTGLGSVLGFSYYGGAEREIGRKIVRSGQSFLVAGETSSTNTLRITKTFGTVTGNGGADPFVLSVAGAMAFQGAVRIIGSEEERAGGIAVDGAGNIYLSGQSTSNDLPVTGNVTQPTRADAASEETNHLSDVFVAKLNPSGTSLLYLTYLGGLGQDENSDVAVTKSGVAYVTGTTYSGSFPVTPSAIQTSVPGPRDGFVTKLNAAGARVYSTYLGGAAADDAVAVATLGSAVWVGASSESSTFPGAGASFGNWDGLLTKLTASALFVVGSTSLTASDTAIRNRLQGLGFNVTTKAAVSTTSADADAKDLVVVSSTVASADVGTKFKRSGAGVITLEDALQDDLGLTSSAAGESGRTAGQTQIGMLTASDPLSANLSGLQTVATSGKNFNWGRPNASSVKVATLSGDATRFTIYRYEAGASLFGFEPDGVTPLRAPDRRVGFFLWEDTAAALTTAGWNLFDAAAKWTAGQ